MSTQTQAVAIQPYRKLVDYVINNPQKGLTIPHSTIEQIIGVPYRKSCNCANSMYKYSISKANKTLTPLTLRLEPIPGYGYRIIEDNEYVYSMEKAYKDGVKSIKKAMFIGDCADVSNLTKSELHLFNQTYNKIQKTLKSI